MDFITTELAGRGVRTFYNENAPDTVLAIGYTLLL
jgi:hypothetical protein